MNVAGILAAIRPTSASAMLVSTCIFVRSSPIRNSVGAANDAATVWPTSTLREITVPRIGDTILVNDRLRFALSSAARVWTSTAAAASTAASATWALASAVSAVCCAISCCAARSWLRRAIRRASTAVDRALRVLACASTRLARAWLTAASNSRGSICAIV